MVPPGEADFLVVLADDQVDTNRAALRAGRRADRRRHDRRGHAAQPPRA